MKEMSASLNSIRPQVGVGSSQGGQIARDSQIGGPSFRDQLDSLQNLNLGQTANAGAVSKLKFSNHAVDRMQARGIRFSPEELARVSGAVDKAAAKGAKNTLLLTDKSALIVSVKDNMVVTVMDKANLKENVFTNIDSTVVL